MSAKTLNLTENLYNYLQKNSLRESALLRELREKTQGLTGAVMQISPEQGQFMALLSQLMQAKRILELGTYTGYSSLVLALSLPQNGIIHTCDVSEESTNIAKNFWERAGVGDKIQLHLGPALETMDKFIDKGEASTYDLIFIDADKANYPAYYEKSLTLLRKGGLIIIDNVLWSGKVADANDTDKSTNTLRELNRSIHGDDRVIISMLPIGDGLTLALKK